MQQVHAGTYPAAEQDAFLSEVARVAIDQQHACGLDQITGGETSADTFILQFPRYLAGISPTDNHAAWGGRGSYVATGPLQAPHGLGIAAAYRRERAIAPEIDKVTIPGPSEITMMVETNSETDRPALWSQAIEMIRAEIQACVALGAEDIQLDLPHIAMGLVDGHELWHLDRTRDVIEQIFGNITGIRRSVHLCYGDFEAQTWTRNRNFQPLLPAIQTLEGLIDRVVLEFSLPEQWADRALLAEVPESMEIAAGIVDVKSPRVATSPEIAEQIAQLLDYVPQERLLICPSCGFGRRNTELAVNKSNAMTQAVRHVNSRLSKQA